MNMRNIIPYEACEWTQNGWAGKGPPDVIWSNPPAHAGPPKPSYPEPCPLGFWVSPWVMTPQSVWPSYASAQSSWEWKMFPDIQRESPALVSAHCPFSPVTVTHCKDPGSAFFSPSLQVSLCIDQMPLSLLISRLKSLSFPSLSSQGRCFILNHLCGLSSVSLQCVPVSLVPRSPGVDTGVQVWPPQGWVEAKDHLH